jgi:hypothetical protein
MNKIYRKQVIDNNCKTMDEEMFKNMVLDGWKFKFQEEIEKLIDENIGVSCPKDLTLLEPWKNYNLFTGFKRRFYFSDNPTESAKEFFKNNKAEFEVVKPKKPNKKEK